jgi:hypothetical protein
MKNKRSVSHLFVALLLIIIVIVTMFLVSQVIINTVWKVSSKENYIVVDRVIVSGNTATVYLRNIGQENITVMSITISQDTKVMTILRFTPSLPLRLSHGAVATLSIITSEDFASGKQYIFSFIYQSQSGLKGAMAYALLASASGFSAGSGGSGGSVPTLVGWKYRKLHVINPASDAGTNYPIKITVHYGSGTDSGGDVYLNGKSRTDFADIRFTKSDGVTLLDYWMEQKVDSNYAVFWVQVSDDLSTNPVTIYIYYGNPSATRADTPHLMDFFQLREHQTSTGYYPKILFTKPSSSIIRIDSYTNPDSFGEGAVFIIMPKNYLDGKRVRVYWNVYYSFNDYRDLQLGAIYVLDTELKRFQSLPIGTIEGQFRNIQVVHYPGPLGRSGWLGWITSTSNVLNLSSFASDYVTLLIRLIDWWVGQQVIVDVDYLQILDQNGNVLLTYHFVNSIIMEQQTTYEDYGLYRKYVNPEPVQGIWGPEEILP